jgi:putative CocE/NonD family hydrolase
MRARQILTVLTTIAVGLGLAPAGAEIPILEEPVLRPDSSLEATSWGYKRKDLALPAAGSNIPVILTMEGYSGAGFPNAYLRVGDGRLMALRFSFGQGPGKDYVRVYASTRGTECSAGSFYLYDRRHAWDAHAIIEFLGTRDWSNGNVGMIGHSFSGQTAFWTATTQPPHLKAVSPNLLHSDIYRDIFMPGAVQNYLFPVVWYAGTPVGGPHRAPYSSVGGAIPNDEICTQHQANRYSAQDPPNLIRDYWWHAIEETDNDWYQMHAAALHAPAIRIPYMQQNNWQDGQPGPRAAVLYNYIKPDPVTICDAQGSRTRVVPKKMLFSNGSHGYGGAATRRMWAFFDIFLKGGCDTTGLFLDADGDTIADNTVENFFEIRGSGELAGEFTARKTGETWPFSDTRWTRLYPRAGGQLLLEAPEGDEPEDTYLSGAATRNYDRTAGQGDVPDQTTTARGTREGVVYQTGPLDADLAIAGPILFKLYASMTGQPLRRVEYAGPVHMSPLSRTMGWPGSSFSMWRRKPAMLAIPP